MGQHSDIGAGNPTRRRGKTLCEAPHADHSVDVVLCASTLKIWLPPSLPARAFGATVVMRNQWRLRGQGKSYEHPPYEELIILYPLSSSLLFFFTFSFQIALLCSLSGRPIPCFSSSHVSRKIHVFEFQSKCVNTTGHCVDTTGIVFKLGFWDSDLVSTPQGTVSTPHENVSFDQTSHD
ncbi:hypothetical protein Taro_044770 [Colocasia esculenta]|uniref:Uncharacterized protein n=1 Tax=Colocasia esculenta TaxID=4460 RepID=A0A843WUV2_COLES|nr:hypothetical protein [Colocasia esculenta]